MIDAKLLSSEYLMLMHDSVVAKRKKDTLGKVKIETSQGAYSMYEQLMS